MNKPPCLEDVLHMLVPLLFIITPGNTIMFRESMNKLAAQTDSSPTASLVSLVRR